MTKRSTFIIVATAFLLGIAAAAQQRATMPPRAGIDWPAFLGAAGLTKVDRISDTQPSATQGIAKLLAEVPLAQWKAYQRLHMLDEAAAVLPQAYRDARFAFRGVARVLRRDVRTRGMRVPDRSLR